MRAVNLLPRQQVERRSNTKETPVVPLVAAIGGAVVLLVLVGGFLLANRSVDRQRQQLSDARALLAATPAKKVSAETQAFRATVLTQREQRSLALAAAIGKRVAWDRILRRMALVVPSDVWLLKVTGSVPFQTTPAAVTTPSALPPTPTALTISGSTYSQAAVARFLERLQVLPDLKNVQLQVSQPDSAFPGVVDFTIISDVRHGGGNS
ncbi:MAG: PilN domain-containing protein [Gaiellaceae bacterium]